MTQSINTQDMEILHIATPGKKTQDMQISRHENIKHKKQTPDMKTREMKICYMKKPGVKISNLKIPDMTIFMMTPHRSTQDSRILHTIHMNT